MKNSKYTPTIFYVVTLLCCVFSLALHAQTFEEENTKALDRMDTESFKEKVLLNKAIALDYQLEPFRAREKNKEGAYLTHLDAIIHIISIKTKANNHETTTTTTTPGIGISDATHCCILQRKTTHFTYHCNWEDY